MPYKDKALGNIARIKWAQKNPKREMLKWARKRCKKSGLDCSADPEDFEMPSLCPILGIKLKWGEGKFADNSATLDRLNNDLGYIKGNVWVVSALANTMKANSRFWHRCKMVNWVLKTLLSKKRYKKHLKHLDYDLLREALHSIEKEKHAILAKSE